MNRFLQVVTTVDTKERAEAMAEAVLERRLAACAQVSGPVLSSYWWQGKIQKNEEWYCIIKTLADRYPELEIAIRSLHPYEEPEIVAFEIADGSATYLQWIAEAVKASRP